MIDLSTFFKNHFDTDRISDENFNQFTSDHLERLSKNGMYPTLVSALTTVYTAWSGTTLSEATNTAIKEGYTVAMNNAVDAIKKTISQQEGTIRGKYGKESPEYQEFFPQGVSEYSNAKLGDIEEKLQRFINAVNAHAADFPAGFATQFTTLLTSFQTARNNQLGKKGAVALDKGSATSTRDAVEVQLMKNLLTIGLDHIGDPDGGTAFFDQTIVADKKKDDKAKTPTP